MSTTEADIEGSAPNSVRSPLPPENWYANSEAGPLAVEGSRGRRVRWLSLLAATVAGFAVLAGFGVASASAGSPTAQAIMFTSAPPASPVVGGSYVVAAMGGASGNPVVFSIDSSTTMGACSISGATVSFTALGSCVIDANQAGNATFAAALQDSQTLNIGQASQAITFTSMAPNPVVGGSYVVSAMGGGSGNPVVFSIDSSSTMGACSISGATVSFTEAGSCVIDANQAGNNSYLAAPQAHQTLSVKATT